ncbi:outer membrane lipid asymmetry maintenance protein MlaD [Desulfobulbus alkaliphilus]|uniref:outer membrane lipid asymmetry maintenance protein MlaD n=1 Tax=Desulfobulbus alkaliphilus TaxID=869814 RepID=UPI0019639538|nr:outer membrane lipid asymmetry maintenance protein MlaD [Desulfobulbus alkaliphilus]MBM9535761.1 outer membrane lipid asymmetry maintenance protein MlaD [Desulfobulbus alkaliphilus]
MANTRIEILVGCFLVAGFLAFGWLALKLGDVPWLTGARHYALEAEFSNISGLKSGADVQIAGVTVGRVGHLRLNEDHMALVTLQIDRNIQIPLDSMASIKSQGIIGDKFIQITLGGDEEFHQPGGLIWDTEPAIDIESLISQFAFGQVGN